MPVCTEDPLVNEAAMDRAYTWTFALVMTFLFLSAIPTVTISFFICYFRNGNQRPQFIIN